MSDMEVAVKEVELPGITLGIVKPGSGTFGDTFKALQEMGFYLLDGRQKAVLDIYHNDCRTEKTITCGRTGDGGTYLRVGSLYIPDNVARKERLRPGKYIIKKSLIETVPEAMHAANLHSDGYDLTIEDPKNVLKGTEYIFLGKDKKKITMEEIKGEIGKGLFEDKAEDYAALVVKEVNHRNDIPLWDSNFKGDEAVANQVYSCGTGNYNAIYLNHRLHDQNLQLMGQKKFILAD